MGMNIFWSHHGFVGHDLQVHNLNSITVDKYTPDMT